MIRRLFRVSKELAPIHGKSYFLRRVTHGEVVWSQMLVEMKNFTDRISQSDADPKRFVNNCRGDSGCLKREKFLNVRVDYASRVREKERKSRPKREEEERTFNLSITL